MLPRDFSNRNIASHYNFQLFLQEVDSVGIFENESIKSVLSEWRYSNCILVAYLSSYHEKVINALYELAWELPAICLPHQDE